MGNSSSRKEHIYSLEIPGTSTQGSSGIFVSPRARPYLAGWLPTRASTLYQSFKASVESFPDRPFLGTRKDSQYTWRTYQEVEDMASKFGYGLASLGLSERDSEGLAFVGIYAKNREEWVITDLGCISQNLATVPLYDVHKAENIKFIVDQTQMKCMAFSHDKLSTIVDMRRQGGLQSLTTLIQYEDLTEEDRAKTSDTDLRIFSFKEILSLASSGTESPPEAESVFTICYTSGTTGNPKGAVITHSNLISTMAGIRDSGFVFSEKDSHLSYLPLAHMLERAIVHYMVQVGGSVGFYAGDVTKIQEDLAILKPTIFISVPRLYNKFYEYLIHQFSQEKGLRKALLDKALSSKMSNYHQYGVLESRVWDRLIFNRVKNSLGGRVRFMLTGSAPIPPEVLRFLKVVFSCPIVEGYGQTETCAASLATYPEDPECGHIGGPITTVEVKLVDVPEMKYSTSDLDETGKPQPMGELCMRGPTVFKGYYKDSEATQENIDEEGWVHSGDIAVRLSHNGAFMIIDRKKNFFKLAQGEYVAAEKVETVYLESPYVSQIFVHGDPHQFYLVAVVVPNEDHIRSHWCSQNEVPQNTPLEELCKNLKLKQDILTDMQTKAKQAKLFGYEQVKKIYLESKPWTPQDLLTPTQKLMRQKARSEYLEVLSEMYSSQ